MNTIKSYLTYTHILLVVLLTLTSCSEIFEGDLGEDTLIVISPSSDLQTVNTQVQFAWEELEDATSYHLRIVSPNFSNLESIELDSSIVGNSFKVTLNPGDYEWRLQAKNAITESNIVTGTIEIDSTTDLSTASVKLLSPSNEIYTNQLVQTFVWEDMYNADVYDFELKHTNGDTTVPFSNYTSSEISINFAYDGKYDWKVIGKNNLSQTQTQPSTRSFTVDTYNPELPSSLGPIDSAEIPLTQGGDSLVSLTWNGDISTTGVAPVKDIIQISTSNAFQQQNIIYEEELSISTTIERNVEVKILTPGTYYWRVKSEDQAQNTSGYTNASSFIVSFTL